MFHTWGHLYAPIHSYAPYIWAPPYVPNSPLCIYMFWGVSACDRGMWGPPYVWTPPMYLDASPCVQHPHAFVWFPACLYVLGVICICFWGHLIPWGFGAISTSVRLMVFVSTSIGCPLCFILYLSCSSLCLKSLLPQL